MRKQRRKWEVVDLFFYAGSSFLAESGSQTTIWQQRLESMLTVLREKEESIRVLGVGLEIYEHYRTALWVTWGL